MNNDSVEISRLESIEQYMSIYGPFFLTTLGIIGNTLSILIFLSPRYRRQSSHFYLLSLALSDLCFLTINLIEDTFRNHNGLYQSRINILDRSPNLICIIVQYARNVTRSLSSWIIVSFTIERLLVVFYPLKRAIICRRKIARYVVFILILISLLNNVNVPVHYGIVYQTNQTDNDTICDILAKYRSIYMRFAISTMITVYLLPMFIIGFVNTLICTKLWRKNFLIKENSTSNSSSGRDSISPVQKPFSFSEMISRFAQSTRSSTLSINSKQISKPNRTSSFSQYQSVGPLSSNEIETIIGLTNDENHSQTPSTRSNHYPLRSKGSTCSIKNYIQSRTHRVTATLLLVSCSFLLLNSPYCAIWIANYIHGFRNQTLRSLKEISELFMLTNFCINFLLYCVSGKAFRNELICLIRCQWKDLYERNEGERRLRRTSRPKIEIQLNDSKTKQRLSSFYRQENYSLRHHQSKQNHQRLSVVSYINKTQHF